MSATLSPPRAVSSTVDEYVANGVAAYLQQIRAIRNTGIEAIFRLGKILIKAKAELAHGAWQDLGRQLPFSLRHAHRFRVIAANPTLANSATWSDLPYGTAILYVLARLDEDVIRAAIGSGQVHPRMTLVDARTLAGKPPAAKLAWDLDAEIQTIERRLALAPDRLLFAGRLQRLVDREIAMRLAAERRSAMPAEVPAVREQAG
jgi:hypothetical protein